VPPGQMPSRGMCRVWIDGVPPGRQPRQTDCRTAERQRVYYEQRYGRNARVIYGDRSYDRYDTRNGGIVLGRRDGTRCRYVERVIAGRVIRQRVCDDNGVYDRNDRVYDRNGNVVYGRDGVYDRIYGRSRDDRDSDSDGHGKGKHKHKGRGRW
jgi:hypothetical protein